jgi:hypothetical protein
MSDLSSLPGELLRGLLTHLEATSLGAAVQSCASFRRLLQSVVEARMERLGSAWPTLFPDENTLYALHVVEELGGAGSSWRYLFDETTLLLHHRPTFTTVHLAGCVLTEVAMVQFRNTKQLTQLVTGHLYKQGCFDETNRRMSFNDKAIYFVRDSTYGEAELARRAAAGSALELFVRKRGMSAPQARPKNECPASAAWTVRADGRLFRGRRAQGVSEGTLDAHGFRLLRAPPGVTPDLSLSSLLHDLERHPGEPKNRFMPY